MFSWVSFLTYAVVTAVTPGPNNIMSMSNGSRRGFRGALPFNFGILAGFSVVMILCTAFCSLLSAWIPKIKTPMLIVGACYMLCLAWETFRSSDAIEEDHSRDGFLSGLLLQFINPKIYIYCIMSMEAYILPFYHGQLLPLLGFALFLALVGFRLCVQVALFQAREARQYDHGASACLLRGIAVSGMNIKKEGKPVRLVFLLRLNQSVT